MSLRYLHRFASIVCMLYIVFAVLVAVSEDKAPPTAGRLDATKDPLKGSSFTVLRAASQAAAAAAIEKRLIGRGATFLGEEKPWTMLIPCDVTTAPQDGALSDAIQRVGAEMGWKSMGQWTDASFPARHFQVMVGTRCGKK